MKTRNVAYFMHRTFLSLASKNLLLKKRLTCIINANPNVSKYVKNNSLLPQFWVIQTDDHNALKNYDLSDVKKYFALLLD